MLVLLAVFVWLDAFELMSLKEISVLLLLGGIGALAAWPVSGRLLDTLPIGFSLYSRFVAPWIEEAIKALIMIALFRMNRIGYKLDAVISGFAIGAGFSVVENILYLTLFPDYGTGTWLVRGFGTAIMHGTTLALLAAIAHEFAERETREAAARLRLSACCGSSPAMRVAVALHMAFNQFPDRPLIAMLGADHRRADRADRHPQLRHRRSAALARRRDAPSTAPSSRRCAPAAGRTGPPGAKIAALAGRLDPEAAKRIRRYWELQAWLVAEAEETMIEEAEGDAEFDPARGPRRLRRARRPQARARPQHLRRAAGAAAVQPQRPMGSRRTQATARPSLTETVTLS